MDQITRRNLLRIGAGGLVTASAGALVPSASAARRPFVAYGPRSYFRSRVRADRIDRGRTAQFRRFMRTHPDQRGYPFPRINGVGDNDWGTAFALGDRRDPLWRLVGDHDERARVLERDGFHAPAWLGDMLTGTNDSPLCVIDRASGFTMFCANAEVVGRRVIQATAGAITFHDSNGLDHRHPRSNDRRNFTSRGRISDAMVIRRDLVDHGMATGSDLGHVLHLFLVETNTADGFRSPMVGCEGGKRGFGAEGERLAIAPWVDLRKRDLSPAALVVARTLQTRGCYIGDNSGSQTTLKAEQENAGRRLWRGKLGRDALADITWDDFVVLR